MLKPLCGQWLLLSILVKLWVNKLLYIGIRYVCRLVTLNFPLVEGETNGGIPREQPFSVPDFHGNLIPRWAIETWPFGSSGMAAIWWGAPDVNHTTKRDFFLYLWRIHLLLKFFLNCFFFFFLSFFCFKDGTSVFFRTFYRKSGLFQAAFGSDAGILVFFCSAPRSWDGPVGHTCPVHTVTHGSGLRSRNCHWQGWLYQEVMWNLREPASFCKVTRVPRWPRNLGQGAYDLSVVCIDWKLIT